MGQKTVCHRHSLVFVVAVTVALVGRLAARTTARAVRFVVGIKTLALRCE